MTLHTAGLHHVTAIASDPQRNADFYTRALGLRLVKRTVNFDDPSTYHLYYGDGAGSPGTLLTFFPWPGARRGRPGGGETAATAYGIPRGTSAWWRERLAAHGGAATPGERFGAATVAFEDPDGMRLELVESDAPAGLTPWSDGPVEAARAIHGFHSVTLDSLASQLTAEMLTGSLGYAEAGEEDGRRRFVAAGGAGAVGSIVDVRAAGPGFPRAELGAGSVHHVAYRATDDAHQLAFQQALAERGARVTEVADRIYFQSIYFREPGGVLFEIATDPPGMTLDEPLERLGESLRLPPWYESLRPRLERDLPPIRAFARETSGR